MSTRVGCHLDGYNKGQKWYGPNRSRNIKKRWQEYTELYKKDLYDQDNHDGVITHLARHPGMQNQVGIRKHHHKQS